MIKIPHQFENNTPVKLYESELPIEYKKLFYWDANVSNFGMPRTQWLDNEEKNRVITPRGKAQNLLCIDSGSTDLFFPFALVDKLKDQTRQPYFFGDVNYTLGDDGCIAETWFEYGGENSILCWWGELKQGRPFQGHNYVVGCDLSKGTGTSNSVAAILDVNTNEIVGLLVTPYLTVPDFAEKAVALCDWVGGNEAPLLIWEENGAADFLKRINELGYYHLYVKENQGGRKVKTGNKYGWRSTAGPNGTKIEVLNKLDAAMNEGLKDNPRFTPIKIYDEQSVNELSSYVWFEGKVDVGPTASQTETSGAKAAHGDRVIAIAIANHGRIQQNPGSGQEPVFMKENSWAYRKQQAEQKEAKQKENGKQWWYN